MKSSDLYLDIRPFYYQQTVGVENNREEIGKQEKGYNTTITQNYYECESEDEVKMLLIQELKILRKQLENELNQRYSFKEVNNDISSIHKTR